MLVIMRTGIINAYRLHTSSSRTADGCIQIIIDNAHIWLSVHQLSTLSKKSRFILTDTKLMSSDDAVSYTHLDVYKRQVHHVQPCEPEPNEQSHNIFPYSDT